MKYFFILFLLAFNLQSNAQSTLDYTTSSSVKCRATSSKILFSHKIDGDHYLIGASEELMKGGASFTKNVGEVANTKKKGILLLQLTVSSNQLELLSKVEIPEELEDANFFDAITDGTNASVLMSLEENKRLNIHELKIKKGEENVKRALVFSPSPNFKSIRLANFGNDKFFIYASSVKGQELNVMQKKLDIVSDNKHETTKLTLTLPENSSISQVLPSLDEQSCYAIITTSNSKSLANAVFSPFTEKEMFYQMTISGNNLIPAPTDKKFSSGSYLYYSTDEKLKLVIPAGDENKGIQEVVSAEIKGNQITNFQSIPVEYQNAGLKFGFQEMAIEKGEGNRLSQISKIQQLENGNTVVFLEQKRITEWKENLGRNSFNDELNLSYGPGIQVIFDKEGKKVSEQFIKYYRTHKYISWDKGIGLKYNYGKNGNIYYTEGDEIYSVADGKGIYQIGKLDDKKPAISFQTAINDNFLWNEHLVLIPRLGFGGKLKLEYYLMD